MKKKKGGHPRKAIRTRVRDGRVSFAVCENERAAIHIKYKLSLKCAADYGREALLRCDIHKARYCSFLKDIDTLTHSEFCRMVVMSSDVVSALSPEERNGEDKTIKGSAIDRKLSAGNIAKMIDGEEYASSSVHGSESQLVLKEHLSFKEVLGEVTMALLDVAAQPTKSREHLDDIYFYGPGRRGRRPGYPGMRR